MTNTPLHHPFNPQHAARRGVNALKPYIPGKPIIEVKEELGLDKVVKLASNECPLAPPDGLIAAIAQEAANLTRYPDGHCRLLKRRLAGFLDIDADCLIFDNGSESCIRLISQTFINPGDEVIIPCPIFDAYKTAGILCGAHVIEVPLNQYRIDLNAMAAKLTADTKLVWLCSPANPTGPAIKRADFEAFLAQAPSHVIVVLDEAYREFVTEPNCAHAADFLLKDNRVIGLRTFSKAFALAGLRVGYVVAHPQVIALLTKVKLPFAVNSLAQAAAHYVLEHMDIVNAHTQLIVAERERVSQALTAMGLMVAPSQASFLFAELPVDSRRVFEHLLSRGFIIRPGSAFDMPRFMRLSLGTREQNQALITLLDQYLS